MSLLGFVLLFAGLMKIEWVFHQVEIERARREFERLNAEAPPEPPKIDRNVRRLEPEERRNLPGQVMPGDMLLHLKRGHRVFRLSGGKIYPVDSVTHQSVNPN